MARFPNLKIVGNFGVGYDSVEVAAAAKRGVVVTNTPEVLTEEVADTRWGCCSARCANSTRPRNGCVMGAGRRRATIA